MGETSEMILEGILCQNCGVYIGDEVGYPRSCSGCKPKSNNKKKKDMSSYSGLNNKNLGKKLSKPTIGDAAIKGVKNFIVKNGLDEADIEVISSKYSIQYNNTTIGLESDCNFIQQDFSKFVKWFRLNYKK